jgi:hypothetical protein
MPAKDLFDHLVRIALQQEGWRITHDPDRQLYLGVPTTIYEKFFHHRFVQKVITKNHVPLLIYQTDSPKVSWVI